MCVCVCIYIYIYIYIYPLSIYPLSIYPLYIYPLRPKFLRMEDRGNIKKDGKHRRHAGEQQQGSSWLRVLTM